MSEMPEGYPLAPLDSNGNVVKQDDFIRIESMPSSVYADYLSEEETADIKSCECVDLKVDEIDEYGFVWVTKVLLHTENEYNTHSFSIEPKYVTKTKST